MGSNISTALTPLKAALEAQIAAAQARADLGVANAATAQTQANKGVSDAATVAAQLFGVGQTFKSVVYSGATAHRNNTGRPIFFVVGRWGSTCIVETSNNGIDWFSMPSLSSHNGKNGSYCVPDGQYFRFNQ